MSDIRTPEAVISDIPRKDPGDITSFLVRCPRGILEGVDVAAARRGISRNAFMLKFLKKVLEGEPQ